MTQDFNNAENGSMLQQFELLVQRFEQLENAILSIVANPQEILNSKEASKYLGIKLSWLDKLCSNKAISFHKTGKLRYFKKTELDKYRLKNIVKSYDELDEEEDEKKFGKSNCKTSKY
jgi:excisionase family DNA binding protein